MNRLFGSSKKETGAVPDVDSVLAGAEARIATLETKIKQIDVELGQLKVQLNKAVHSSVKASLQNKAKRLLTQRKMLSAQVEQQGGIAMNLSQVSLSTSSIQASMASLNALKTSARAIEQTQRSMKIREVEKLQDKLSDLLEYNAELQHSLGASLNYETPEGIDDEELERELDALQDQVFQEPETSYLDLPQLDLQPPPEAREREKEGVI